MDQNELARLYWTPGGKPSEAHFNACWGVLMDRCQKTDPHFVTVTACDWNGSSFDGLPFEPFTKWLQTAMRDRRVEVYRDSRDYAVWVVATPSGSLIAYPGDQIHNVNGNLVLSQHPSNKSEVRIPIPERITGGI